MRRILIVMVKAPRFGCVKTRLAADIGMMAAWRFYRHSLNALLCRLGRDRRWRLVLAVTPDRFAAGRAFWPCWRARLPQGQGDLGRRMRHALLRPWRAGDRVVLIGGDIPAVEVVHIDRAFRALARRPMVIGPSADGGFWLIGIRHCRHNGLGCTELTAGGAFSGIRWSRPDVLQRLLANMRHRPPLSGECLRDVDDAADLCAARSRGVYPRLCSCSRSLGSNSTKLHGRRRMSS